MTLGIIGVFVGPVVLAVAFSLLEAWIQEGEATEKRSVTPEQHFTQAPPRYTEATLVKRMRAELNAPNAFVVATGGMAVLVAQGDQCIDKLDGLLTLKGLRILYERNR